MGSFNSEISFYSLGLRRFLYSKEKKKQCYFYFQGKGCKLNSESQLVI